MPISRRVNEENVHMANGILPGHEKKAVVPSGHHGWTRRVLCQEESQRETNTACSHLYWASKKVKPVERERRTAVPGLGREAGMVLVKGHQRSALRAASAGRLMWQT